MAGIVLGPGSSWPSVPAGCTLQRKRALHFSTNPKSDNARGVSGEFQSICRRQYKLGPPNMATCPSGTAILTLKDCRDAFFELQGKFNAAPVSGMLIGGASVDVPNFCSVRVNPAGNNHPSWRFPATNNAFQAGNFQVLCKAG